MNTFSLSSFISLSKSHLSVQHNKKWIQSIYFSILNFIIHSFLTQFGYLLITVKRSVKNLSHLPNYSSSHQHEHFFQQFITNSSRIDWSIFHNLIFFSVCFWRKSLISEPYFWDYHWMKRESQTHVRASQYRFTLFDSFIIYYLNEKINYLESIWVRIVNKFFKF